VEIAQTDYGITLDFSQQSLNDLNRLLDRAHSLITSPAYAGKAPDRTIQVWGAYLGETIRRANNGTWTENPAASVYRQYSINTPTGNIFPMEQVYVRVVEGKKNNLIAAIIEPPTRRAGSNRQVFLLVEIIGLLALIAGSYWLFFH
jgi:hypothetical protein